MGCRRALGAALVLVLAAGGCAGFQRARPAPRTASRGPEVATDFTPSAAVAAPSRPPDCYLDVVFDRSPERPYVVIGRVSASWLGRGRVALAATEAEVVPLLRREACRAGAHVIFSIETSSQDHLLLGRRGPRLARSVRGTAVAAVYVRPSGHLEPPPPGPGRVIRVPARLEGEETPAPAPGDERGDDIVWDEGLADPWAVPAP